MRVATIEYIPHLNVLSKVEYIIRSISVITIFKALAMIIYYSYLITSPTHAHIAAACMS